MLFLSCTCAPLEGEYVDGDEFAVEGDAAAELDPANLEKKLASLPRLFPLLSSTPPTFPSPLPKLFLFSSLLFLVATGELGALFDAFSSFFESSLDLLPHPLRLFTLSIPFPLLLLVVVVAVVVFVLFLLADLNPAPTPIIPPTLTPIIAIPIIGMTSGSSKSSSFSESSSSK
jgi:hypothetical protein